MQIDLRNVGEMPRATTKEVSPLIAAAQKHLTHLRLVTAGLLPDTTPGPAVVVVFEGFDASGKGGAIRRVAAGLDPRHVSVVPVGPPNATELAHHFLWRFQPSLPGIGGMTIFDRSWYGRVLVERVDGLIDRATVVRSFNEINDFERSLAGLPTIVVKFWMHVSSDEQLRRFEERRESPLKRWKLTDADWHNRSQREAYIDAANEMLAVTDTPDAEWNVVLGDDKDYARLFVLTTLNQRIEEGLMRYGITPPTSEGRDYLA